jgi:hypothetical protein
MFSRAFVCLWVTVAMVTVIADIMPVSLHLPRPVFYSYKTTKVILFVLLGYLGPLTFWRFDSLGLGALFALGSAATVEVLQGWIQSGHAFSLFELAAKLFLIGAGFVTALNARYDGELNLGVVRLDLRNEHLSNTWKEKSP